MKTFIKLLSISTIFLVINPIAAETLSVYCDKGDLLNDTISMANSDDVIEVSGMCREAITIQTDGLTINGAEGTVIDGSSRSIALTVDGAQRVAINGMVIRNGIHGVLGKQNASFKMSDMVVKDNAVMGIRLEGGTSLEIQDSKVKNNNVFGVDIDRASEIMVTGRFVSKDNGVFGMIFSTNSSGTFKNAEVIVKNNVLGIQVGLNSSLNIADAETVVKVKDNQSTGLTVVSGSSLLVFEGKIIATNNQFNHGVSVNSNSSIDLDRGGTIISKYNGQDGIKLENSIINLFNMPGQAGSNIIVKNNGRHGIGAFTESVVDLSSDSFIKSRNNEVSGLLVDNGSTARIINSKIRHNGSNDIELSFGTRADLTNNTADNIVCDASVLIRGDMDITCPVM